MRYATLTHSTPAFGVTESVSAHKASVIAMGACTITGGMFSVDSPNAVRGVDKLIPVDVYLPGCPPRPEAIMDALIKLRKKIANETVQEREKTEQTHRYYSRIHQMKVVQPINDGKYLEVPERQAPSKELAEAVGLPIAVHRLVAEGE